MIIEPNLSNLNPRHSLGILCFGFLSIFITSLEAQSSIMSETEQIRTPSTSISTAGSVAYLNGSSEIILYKTLDLLSGISFSFRTCYNGGTIIKFDSSQSMMALNNFIPSVDSSPVNGKDNVKIEVNGRSKKMVGESINSVQYLFLHMFINPDGFINVTFKSHQFLPISQTINYSTTLNTSSPINDNKWHLVELRIKNYDLLFTFDHTTFKMVHLGPDFKYAPSIPKDSHITTPYIRLGKYLKGCIQQGANIVFNYLDIASKNILWDNCPLETSGPCDKCLYFVNYCMNGGECVTSDGEDNSSTLRVCQCKDGYVGDRCQAMSPNNTCESKPCLNNALCLFENKTREGYKCLCAKGFEGKNCETNLNECEHSPCRDGSTCLDTVGSFNCICAAGYTGTLCEYHLDECSKKPCKNSGTCIRTGNWYKCQCPPSYMGYNCEIPTNQCKAALCPQNSFCARNNGDIKCKCLQGYTGVNCDQDINECQSMKVNPCENNGQCVNEIGDYKCVCPPEWLGKNCSDKFDPCLQEPCLNNGTCYNYKTLMPDKSLSSYYKSNKLVVPFKDAHGTDLSLYRQFLEDNKQNDKLAKYNRDQYYCSCVKGYRGKNCEENIDDCVGVKCPPGKICVDKLNSFECLCPRGFDGPTCNLNINDCDPMPCRNNATCVDKIAGYMCVCPNGYKGRLCEEDIDECQEKICIYGICSNSFGNYRCYCIPGFTGRHCDVNFDDCASHPCQNGGICTDLLDNYACVCKAGFTGKDCQININECAANPCSGNGNCTDAINEFKCNCFPGYTGTLCEQDIDECQPDPCLNGGKCIDKINGFQCECKDTGFTGKVCEVDIDECLENPCFNGGTCRDQLSDYHCQCPTGFKGKNCEIDIDECLTNPCKNGGTCQQKYNLTVIGMIEGFENETANTLRYDCICAPGFEGPNCEINIDECRNKPCIHGTCVDEINGFHCDCEAGYQGQLCEKDINECLRDRPCQNNGFCNNLVNNYTCRCQKEYGGRNCEVKLKGCSEHLCPEKTECWPYLKNDTEHTYECHCLPGLAGKACNIVTVVSFFGSNVSYLNHEPPSPVEVKDHSYLKIAERSSILSTASQNITYSETTTVSEFAMATSFKGELTIPTLSTMPLPKPTQYFQNNTVEYETLLTTMPPSLVALTTDIFPSEELKAVESGTKKRRSIAETNPSLNGEVNKNNRTVTVSASYIKVPLERLSTNSYYDFTTAYYNYIYSNIDRGLYDDYYLNLHFQFITTLKFTNLVDIILEPKSNRTKEPKSYTLNVIETNTSLAQYTRINVRVENGRLVCTIYNSQCHEMLVNEKSGTNNGSQCYRTMFTSSQNVDKGEWQTLILNKTKTMMAIDLMNEDMFSTQYATGINILSSIQFGGTFHSNKMFNVKGFIGCMRDIYVNDLLVLPESKTVSSNKVKNSCHRLTQCYETSCSGNGKCFDEWNSYSCNCRRPYFGVDCKESFDEITFGYEFNQSLLHIALPMVGYATSTADMDVSFFIKTRLQNEFLMLLIPHNLSNNSYNFYLEVCLNTGNLQVTLTDADNSLAIFRSDVRIVDENYPFVRILKMKDDLIIIIDTKRFTKKNFFPDFLTLFYVKDIYVGSLPKEMNLITLKCGNIDQRNYLKGTLWDFRIGNDIIPLTNFTLERAVSLIQNVSLSDKIIAREVRNLTLGSPSDNACRINPCVNGASCIVTWNDYNCVCLRGFKGKHCETYDPCASVTCQEDTSCFTLSNITTQCLELVLFEGRKNQGLIYKPILPQTKYIQELNAANQYVPVIMNFKLRTRASECLIYHMANTKTGDFLTFYIHRGKFAIKFNLWSDPSKEPQYMNSTLIIAKGEWAYLNVSFQEHSIKMIVNGYPFETDTILENMTPLWNLINSSSHVYLGGVPGEIDDTIKLDTMSQYKGCMNNVAIFTPARKFLLPLKKSVWDNESEFDTIFQVSSSNGVYRGCSPPNACKSDSCKNGGTCVDIFDAYNCTCPPGFNGPVCENNINDCTPDACDNGTCIDGIMSYECKCFPGFIGKRCDIKINPCENSPCQNGGVCRMISDLNYTCDCGPSVNFIGEFCHIPSNYNCSNGNICQNNGVCVDGNFQVPHSNQSKSFECRCPTNFEGTLCEKERDYCQDNKCQNGACRAHVSNQNYTCECNEGFKGVFCDEDIDECKENPNLCENKGICNNTRGNFTCTCAPGWTGRTCSDDIDECADLTNNPCQNFAVCNNERGNFSCNCNSTGYTGPLCDRDIDECEEASTNLCNDNGRCVNTEGKYHCECHKGYSGPNCESVNCSLIQCEHNGTCQITPNNTWKCLCSQNSYGRFCENLSFCLYEPCVSGICLNRPNPKYGVNYTCECDASHTGPNCSELIDHCAKDNACLQGNCVNRPNNYTCQCFPGYTGADCSININDCEPNPCNNSGICLDDINYFKCLCEGTGFEGPTCNDDVDECLQNPCKNNGTCVNLPGSYKCECPGYLGENCDNVNPCEPNPCLNGGTCKTALANEVAISQCHCVKPFTGDTCGINPNAEPLKGSGGERKVRNIAALIAGPIAAIILFIGLIALVAFILTAKKKRATRGAYSPSKQEVTGSRVELDQVLKPPPEERLI